MAAKKSDTLMSDERWLSIWNAGQAPWHKAGIHGLLEKNYNLMLGGREHIKVFVPLCGKTRTLKWLYERGHTVVGVEFSLKAVEIFFAENNMKYTVTDAPSVEGKLCQSEDGRLRVYCCNIFAFSRNVENGFTAVWDRGALEAINPEDRKRYIDMMKDIMSDDCQYMLANAEYLLTEVKSGPPHMLPIEDINQMLGAEYKIDYVDFVDNILDEGQGLIKPDMTKFNELLFHIHKHNA